VFDRHGVLRGAALFAFVLALLLPTRLAAVPPLDGPRVFLLNPDALLAAKAAVARRDPAILPAWDALKGDADKALAVTRFSVVDKGVAPPSGDKHDYMSQAPYFWPDPAKPDGKPYLRKDGERNPEIDRITDHRAIDGLVANTQTLGLAFYLSGDERYAEKAAALVRAFYLDPATRMNPNLEYAQFIPGVNTGRGIGLIETRGFTRVIDAMGLIGGSKAWRPEDDREVRAWFAAFLKWMQESENGQDESAAKNNHGTYYDLQVTSFALFLDRAALAKQILEQAKQKRIAVQIEPDGRQPLELARTNAWSYSNGNLDGMTELATLGDRAGVDLWHYITDDGRSIRKAILYLAPYSVGDKKWDSQQIGTFNPQALHGVLRRAASRYDDAGFQSVVKRLPALPATDRAVLAPR
jgi:Alginate lyase